MDEPQARDLATRFRLAASKGSAVEELQGGDARDFVFVAALPAVRTAFVLYPGQEAAAFEIRGAEPGAVGAIPLVPGAPAESLVDHVRAIVTIR